MAIKITHFEPSWLSLPGIQHLIAVFEEAAIPICFFGGAIRDALLGREPLDFDISAAFDSARSLAVLQQSHIPVTYYDPVTHKIQATCDGKNVDIFCTQKSASSIAEFIPMILGSYHQENDYTMNKLHMSPSGQLYDPVGGVADIRAHCVRMPADPKSVYIDRMGISRLFRFISVFGTNVPDIEKYLAVCIQHKEKLFAPDKYPVYCNRQMDMLFHGRYVALSLTIMRERELMEPIFGGFSVSPEICLALQEAETYLDQQPMARHRLAALLLATETPAKNLAKMAALWQLPDKETQHLQRFIAHSELVESMPLEPDMLWHLQQQMGSEDAAGLILVGLALQFQVTNEHEDRIAHVQAYKAAFEQAQLRFPYRVTG